MEFTTTHLAMLVLALIAGWLFGLASHPGGRKWRDRYAAERDAHAAARRDADTRVASTNARVTELERENTRLASAAPVTAATIQPADPVVAHPSAVPITRPVAATTARHAYAADGTRRGWFDWR